MIATRSLQTRAPSGRALDPASLEREGAVAVWPVALDGDEGRTERLCSYLSADELERAHRFYFERDRRRFVVGRALLRLRLGAYLARDPKSLRFAYNEFGKPSVADETELRFNVSHAEDCALYAFTLSGDVGVDVEPVRAGQVHDEVAHRFFARPEVEALERLPPERRGEAFAACWTRKEAFIKARGDGLSAALDTFVVSLPDEPPALLWTAWSAIEPGEWCFADLSALTPGYIAAIAVRARRLDVVIDEWEPTRA